MTEKITIDVINQIRQQLHGKIISLLRENNIKELEFDDEDESPSATDVVVYSERYDSWTENRVIAVGICDDDDWYLKVYDDVESEEMTVYDSEYSLATKNINWLVYVRDSIVERLSTLKNE